MPNYALKDFGFMIGPKNRHRVAAFHEAMAMNIASGCTVLEIGTGVGFFAMLACYLGAGHVYALEPNRAIVIGKEIAMANRFDDRITFIDQVSTDVSLPEAADLIISDMRGSLPWQSNHIPSIVDARDRLLKRGGVQIPKRDTVKIALVRAPNSYAKLVQDWEDCAYGFDLSAARQRQVNQIRKVKIRPEQIVGEEMDWAVLDYRTITADETDVDDSFEWRIDQACLAHGICGWFESELTADVLLSNAPGKPHNPAYGQMFFPWEWPIHLAYGDRVRVRMIGEWQGHKEYIWRWHTCVQDSQGKMKIEYKQSTQLSRIHQT